MSLFSIANPLLGVILPLLTYIFLRLLPALDSTYGTPGFHFQIVSTTSIVSFLISVGIGIVGIRKRNLQIIYVSLAFVSLAGLFSIHGLSTPGFILGPTRLVGVAAQLSVLTMAFWLMLSTLPTDHPLSAWISSRARYLVWLWTPVIIIAGIIALNNPASVDWVPVDEAPLRSFVALLTLVMSIFAGYRFWAAYRYSRFPFQLAMAYVGGWIAVSQIIITTGITFYLSWWIYHGLLLLSVIVVILGLVAQYSRENSLVLSVRGLFSNDARERLQAGISPSVRALVAATEARDVYTAGHSYRVALGAVTLGSALNLPPEELRALAQGGILHDIGKLQIPDNILGKAGPLNPEERAEIEKHVTLGYEMCARLGFMQPELEIIRSHHERPDGQGYPDRLSADQIPRIVKILTVADVYDALTSDRAYRDAWTQEQALEYLQENRGTQFDPDCVDTWVVLVRSDAFNPKTGQLLGY